VGRCARSRARAARPAEGLPGCLAAWLPGRSRPGTAATSPGLRTGRERARQAGVAGASRRGAEVSGAAQARVRASLGRGESRGEQARRLLALAAVDTHCGLHGRAGLRLGGTAKLCAESWAQNGAAPRSICAGRDLRRCASPRGPRRSPPRKAPPPRSAAPPAAALRRARLAWAARPR
jgi:hypothetical protein